MKCILAIETSCDETAAAVLKDGVTILGSAVHTQIADHHKFGGVVPEIASRKHIESILPVIQTALDEAGLRLNQIDAIAATLGPGLIGSLLIGLTVAKAIAFVTGLPIIPVDHLEGHIYAAFLSRPGITFPFVSLVVSGGHTDLYYIKGHGVYELLGQTRDDAAGEAFDKVAKVLGLGYPGGPIIDEIAKKGDPKRIEFPRASLEKGSLDFSFSGLKTAVFNHVRYAMTGNDTDIPSIAACFQEAVVDVLAQKAIAAVQKTGVKTLALGGGVASNTWLRERLKGVCEGHGLDLVIPEPRFCVDNACMIGVAGFFNQQRATRDWGITPQDKRFATLVP